MPEAAHHEFKVVELKDSRYKARVECTGCNFQSHVLPEEDPNAVGKQHQRRWGYVKPSADAVKVPPPNKPVEVKVVPTPEKVENPTQPPSQFKMAKPATTETPKAEVKK